MDIWQLVTPGRKGEDPKCSICGTSVVMVLDESGNVLGTLEDKRERQRVRLSGIAVVAGCCFCAFECWCRSGVV